MRDSWPRRSDRRSRWRGGSFAGLVVALVALLLYQYFERPPSDREATTATTADEPGAHGAVPGDFDFYLLALTLEPAFCEDGPRRIEQCRRLTRTTFERTPLVLHGLWPENDQPRTYPVFCANAPLELSSALRERLRRWMPGVSERLDEHQWRKHGACTRMSGERYFEVSIALTAEANEVLGPAIRRHAGGRVEAATLRAAAEAVRPGFGQRVVFMCKNLRSADPARRGRPYLIEVRLCIDNDGPDGEPLTPLSCAAVQRRDQGCGPSFWIDDV